MIADAGPFELSRHYSELLLAVTMTETDDVWSKQLAEN